MADADRDDSVRGPLYVRQLGTAGPTLAFLPGIGATTRYWALVVAPLAATARLLLVDLLGFGRSPKPWTTYTVDRHLWEAAANASQLVDRVGRPDLLVLGALLHDLGKGYPGDHTDAGIDLVREIGPKLGLPAHDVAVLMAMVEHHLLLPDVAVRRDLTDPATIRGVADQVATVEVLELLHALMASAGSIVTREDLMREVWETTFWTSSKTIDVHLGWLRRKLGDDSRRPDLITTIRGRGLRFETGVPG